MQYFIIIAIIFVQASLRIGIVDGCNDTIPFTIGSTIKVNKQNSTVDVILPDDCIDGTSRYLNGLLLRFTGTGQRLAVRACDNITSAYSNPFYISIYQGEFCPNTWSCVTASEFPCQRERLIFDTIPGVIYTVFALVQEETFDVSIVPVPRVSNDVCSNAQTLTLGSTVNMDTTYATSDKAVLNDCFTDSPPYYPGVWFNLTGTGDQVVVKACSSIGPLFSIYKGGCDPSTLVCVATAEAACTQQFSFDTEIGTSYTILVQTLYEGMLEFSIFARQKPRPSGLAMVNGDPHITTLDGLTFDCQARGEFTMFKSLDSNLQIQGRFTKPSKLGNGPAASVLSGLVIREVNDRTIQIGYSKSATAASIDGCIDMLKLYIDGIHVPFSSYNLIDLLIDVQGDQVYFYFYLTRLLVVTNIRLSSSFGCFLSILILLQDDSLPMETLTGLLGNANGHVFDDWQTNLGTPLPKPDRNASLFQGGYDYCRTEWCIRNVADSLFTYDSGESFVTYFDCDAPYQPDIENTITSASIELRELCGANKECLIDGIVGTIDDARRILNDTVLLDAYKESWNVTYNLNETAPSSAPSKASTKAPTKAPPTPVIVPVPVPTPNVVAAPLAVPTPVKVPVPITVIPNTVPVSSPFKDDVPVPVPISGPTPAFVPIPVPVKPPSNVPSECGIFGSSLFCPLKFRGIIGRFLRRLFGLW